MTLPSLSIAAGLHTSCSNCQAGGISTLFVTISREGDYQLPKTSVKFRSSSQHFYAWLCMKDFHTFLREIGWVGDGQKISEATDQPDGESPIEELLVKAEIEYSSDGSSVVTLIEKE